MAGKYPQVMQITDLGLCLDTGKGLTPTSIKMMGVSNITTQWLKCTGSFCSISYSLTVKQKAHILWRL